MEAKAILYTLGTLLGALGGGAVIIFALSGFLGKIWAERLMQATVLNHEKDLEDIRDKYQTELERLRVKLKKSEFLFEKEFLACSLLVEFHEEIIPLSKYPEMHMDDVYESIACSFENIEKWIKQFVSKHGAVLPKKTAQHLMLAARTCGQNKFNIGEGPEDITEEEFKAGEAVCHYIRGARDTMRNKVWEQSST